jgi:hypothetical protein
MTEFLTTQSLRGSGRIAADGLELREGIDFDTWNDVGSWLVAISNASAWCLGDWLVYGQRAFGERYRTALVETGLDYQTLRNYAWVARRFPHTRRHKKVSFQHHAEVAALPEPVQELWLQRAERLRWSRNELRRQLGSARRSHVDPVAEDPVVDDPVVVRIKVQGGRERHWREAAAACDQSLVDWMVTLADLAASAALDHGPSPSPVEASGRFLRQET